MEAQQIQQAFDELNGIIRRARGNARSDIYARRMRDAITVAYELREAGKWLPREGASTEKADKLVAMGVTEAVYGRGRSLLEK